MTPVWKTIKTKYIPAKYLIPSKIKAFDEDGHSVTASADSLPAGVEGHRAVVQMLLEKMKWDADLVVGGWGSDYIFVMVKKGSAQ